MMVKFFPNNWTIILKNENTFPKNNGKKSYLNVGCKRKY